MYLEAKLGENIHWHLVVMNGFGPVGLLWDVGVVRHGFVVFGTDDQMLLWWCWWLLLSLVVVGVVFVLLWWW